MTLVSNKSAGGFRRGYKDRELNAAMRREERNDPGVQAERARINAERQAILSRIEEEREAAAAVDAKRVHAPAQTAAGLLRKLQPEDLKIFVDASRYGFDWGTFAREVSQIRAEIDVRRERERTTAFV